ncbi:uncharacterized protein METZ01_LOCUS357762 [marine metagenome]|jgi:hypothetical protein|uniref:Uncharacterized protein n=1 Tax=marine metagenome TaxID=408172 RepID=A0A382S6V5_9ZZZZ|tara:strand:- start:392 stop:577 length:186 start_codon:yes stop_codon:yes gene_type:complete
MATIIWEGWSKEPKEDCQVAYEFLTGRRTKPFYVVFGRPETLKNQPEEDLDDQAELGENEE